MARRKTLPESVRAKYSLAERLCALRSELYGDRGGPELARRLGIPIRTWYNYEAGVTVPAEVVLKIIELTSVEPAWLLHGKEPKFRPSSARAQETIQGPLPSVNALLRTALQILEHGEARRAPAASGAPGHESPGSGAAATADVVLIGVDEGGPERLTTISGPRYIAAQAEWLDAERDCRCIRIVGDAMSPIVADGAYVAFSKSEETPAALDGKMVVAWIEDKPIVRWFQDCGRYALLRAENPAADPPQILVDLEHPTEGTRFRRVLWINTPH